MKWHENPVVWLVTYYMLSFGGALWYFAPTHTVEKAPGYDQVSWMEYNRERSETQERACSYIACETGEHCILTERGAMCTQGGF